MRSLEQEKIAVIGLGYVGLPVALSFGRKLPTVGFDIRQRRIDDAARFMPLEQMALSPQCGFSSTVHGNAIAVEAQRAKLALVVETANDVWGSV